MQQFGKALDEVRAAEAKRLVNDGYEPVLKRSRWCFLKRPEELDGPADREAVRDFVVQPSDRACIPASGGVPAALGILQRVVGREIPGRVDGPGDAFAAGTDEEDRSQHSQSSTVDSELVPGSRAGLGRGCRGSQQLSQTRNQKVIRFSDGGRRETGSIACPWPATRARTHPQILLSRQKSLRLRPVFSHCILDGPGGPPRRLP